MVQSNHKNLVYFCPSIQPSPLLALFQFDCPREPKMGTNTPTAGRPPVSPQCPPGRMTEPICPSVLNCVQRCIVPGGAEATFPPLIGVRGLDWPNLCDFLHPWAKEQVSFPQPYWLPRGNRGLSGRGKVETAWKVINTCHHLDHCYPGTRERTAHCPGRCYLCLYVGSGNLAPPKLVKIAIRSNFLEIKHTICLPNEKYTFL